MKSLLVLLCVVLTVFAVFSLYADTPKVNEINLYELNRCPSPHDLRSSIKLNWLIERYDFDQIEAYINQYYGTYYKYYERYLTIKQREFAYKLGLSDILLKPNLRRYENTKLVFVRNVWNDKLTFRYMAPVGNVGDFEFSVAFRPSQSVSLILRSEVKGESSIAASVNYLLGSQKENRNIVRRTKRLLRRIIGAEI